MKKQSAQTWTDKLNKKAEHKVKHIEKKFSDIPENSDMLVATPKIFENYLKKIPKGKSVPIKKIRSDLAKKYLAEYTCPVTTGLFLRIVAEAAFEQIQKGLKPEEVAPFWRAIEPGSSIAKKLSFGTDIIKKLRKEEGID